MKKISLKVMSLVLCLATLLSVVSLLSACNDNSSKNKEFTVIAENGVSQYVIIRSEKISSELLDTILDLRRQIVDNCGLEMKITTDWVKNQDEIDPNAKEILVGKTNRPESQEVIDSLEPNSWAVVDKGNKIVICANNDSLLCLAIDWFVKNCVNSQDKTIKIEKELSKSEGFGDALPLSIGAISSYQIVYPKGNDMLEYYASLIQRKAKISTAVSDNAAQSDYGQVLRSQPQKEHSF